MKPNEASRKPILGFLSAPAKILFFLSSVALLIGTYLGIENEVYPNHSLPIIVFLLPGIFLALSVFGIGYLVLKLFRIPVVKLKEKQNLEVVDDSSNRNSGSKG